MMSNLSWLLSIIALVFSVFAFAKTLKLRRLMHTESMSLKEENLRLQKAAFYYTRNLEFESKLAEWPDALKFYGIDVQKIKQDEGISEQQITYIVLSIHSLSAYCQVLDIDIYDQMKKSDYRQKLFSHRETRKVWKYAKLVFSENVSEKIDKYLDEQYPSEI